MPRARRKSSDPVDMVLPDTDQLAEDAVLQTLLRSLEYDPREVIDPVISPDQLVEESEILSGSLRKFIPAAWSLVEPSAYIPNWHIDAIAEHCEAVAAGDIQYLLVTMPPRHSKSLVLSVLYPAWEWIQQPFNRWVFASYAFNLTVRDSVKRRKILKSEWFQRRFADRFSIIAEQDTKIRFENDHHGFMLASSVGGSNTGEGGERIVADDPHNIKKSESEDIRQDTVNWWNVVMSTRRNDLKRSARIVVQQRTNEGDVAGDIIERGEAVHLNLPTEFMFAGTARCFTKWVDHKTGNERHWEDPRTEPGELLNPKRFDAKENELAKLDLGDYQYAAQHGQNPTPPSGTIIKREWLKFYGGPGQPAVPDFSRSTHPMMPLFSLDCTFKEHKDTDYVCGLGWAMFGADIYLLPQRIHDRLSFTKTLDAVAEFVGGHSLDKSKKWPGIYPFMKFKLVEDKANGTAILDTLRHQIPGMIPFEPGGASKESRMISASWRFRAGNIFLPHKSIAPWIDEYVYELCAFPKARRDDYVDATSQMLLFVGGDPSIQGQPIVEMQESKWFGQLRNEELQSSGGSISGAGGSSSLWGNLSGVSGKSIWRH